jgi:hypothetical protein
MMSAAIPSIVGLAVHVVVCAKLSIPAFDVAHVDILPFLSELTGMLCKIRRPTATRRSRRAGYAQLVRAGGVCDGTDSFFTVEWIGGS